MENYKITTISIDQETRKIIETLAQEKRQNFSAALRLIVADWQKANQPTNGNGKQSNCEE